MRSLARVLYISHPLEAARTDRTKATPWHGPRMLDDSMLIGPNKVPRTTHGRKLRVPGCKAMGCTALLNEKLLVRAGCELASNYTTKLFSDPGNERFPSVDCDKTIDALTVRTESSSLDQPRELVYQRLSSGERRSGKAGPKRYSGLVQEARLHA